MGIGVGLVFLLGVLVVAAVLVVVAPGPGPNAALFAASVALGILAIAGLVMDDDRRRK